MPDGNPYCRDADDQRAELVDALTEAFDELGIRNVCTERLAQQAVEVMCDQPYNVLQVLAVGDEWVADLLEGDSDGTYGGPYDYRTAQR